MTSLSSNVLNSKAPLWCATTSVLLHALLLVVVYTTGSKMSMSSADKPAATSLYVQLKDTLKQKVTQQVPPKIVSKPKPRKKLKRKTEVKKVVQTQKTQQKEAKPNQALNPRKSFDLYIKNYVEPNYPRLAQRRGITGRVILFLLVGQDGKVTQVKVTQSSGHRMLDESAVAAAKKWQFKANAARTEQIKLERRIVFTM